MNLYLLACVKLNLTPNQVINATTLNGAHAMEISDNYGSIDFGKKPIYSLQKNTVL